MAQQVKAVLCNHEDPGSVPSTYTKSQAWQCTLVIPDLRMWREMGSLDLTGHPT